MNAVDEVRAAKAWASSQPPPRDPTLTVWVWVCSGDPIGFGVTAVEARAVGVAAAVDAWLGDRCHGALMDDISAMVREGHAVRMEGTRAALMMMLSPGMGTKSLIELADVLDRLDGQTRCAA